MSIIFVTGGSRSGTTMMSRILNKNSSVFTFSELHFFEQLCESDKLNDKLNYDAALVLCDRLLGIQHDGFLQYKQKGKYFDEAKKILADIDENQHTPIIIYQEFIKDVVQKQGKNIGCEQTPRNVLYIEDILNNIPDAKIICLVRDPRAVLLSQKNKWKRRYLGAAAIPIKEAIRSFVIYHPFSTTKMWAAAARESIKWKDNDQVLLVKYEDVVDDPAKTVQTICTFLNIEFQPPMLQVPRVGSSNKTDIKDKLEISSAGKDVWRKGGLTKAERYICQKKAGVYMSQLNYEKETFPIPYPSVVWQWLIFPVKTTVAILFNFSRAKNFKQAILKRL